MPGLRHSKANPARRLLRTATTAAACAAVWLGACAFTVVVDPGHGGRDHGCIGNTQREKDINLDVALRVRDMLLRDHKDVKVVMTRSTDVFIPLQERCNIANKAKGDIFVSIHTNSVDAKNPRRTSVEGASVYTLGQRRSDTNLDVAMRENSVIKLEDDYSTTYCGFDPSSAESYIIFELSQSAHLDSSIRLAGEIQQELCSTAGRKDMGVRQEPFWVLVRTSMPAVLVELDYVCNPQVENFLASDQGRDHLARSISNGIAAYRGDKASIKAPAKSKEKRTGKRRKVEVPADGGAAKEADTTPVAENEAPAAEPSPAPVADVPAGTMVYKVQFLLSSRPLDPADKRLEGLDATCYVDGGSWKYTTGAFTDVREAEAWLRQVRNRYKDAFIIKTIDGKRVK